MKETKTSSNISLESLHEDYRNTVYNKALNQFAAVIYQATRFLMSSHPDGFRQLADGISFDIMGLNPKENEACGTIEAALETDICEFLGLEGSEETTRIINNWFQQDLIQQLGDVYGMHDYEIFWNTETYDIDFERWDPAFVEIMYY